MASRDLSPSTCRGDGLMAATDKPRLLDLFSGIGGFSLGLERAGFETVAFCEISPKCRHLLQHHWPEVRAYDDICTLTAERLAADGIAVDAICGGFPCQDISFAGKGAGLAGERSGLWREYARLVRELRPRVIIVENVAALLGRGLGVVLGDLAALGYDAWWDCIPASAVGAHHRRDRLWIVAYARSIEHQGYGNALRWAVAEELLGAAALVGAQLDSAEGDLAHAAGERFTEARGDRRDEPAQRSSCGSVEVSDAPGARWTERWRQRDRFNSETSSRGQSSPFRVHPRGPDRNVWLTEPNVGRVAHGVPARVDRLHGLGNAVVPQIPEILGRAILTARQAQSEAA